jgi:putative nucleotidyltransferase with HDIG domain
VTCLLISLLSKSALHRDKIFTVGVEASIFTFILSIAITLFFDKPVIFDRAYSATLLNGAAVAAANGIVTVIVCIGSLPIWENLFGIVTILKLQDLSNPNNELLRRLTMEAPGTYHHSLIVSNLAETAAYDIGANADMVRVGAYYHDIGKLKYPQYFIENQAGENPHDTMDPYSSVQVIISHVTHGLELADNYKLPKVIKDFIAEHHGNSLIQYFYYKYQSENPGEVINEDDFRYKSKPPQSKETAIVMLADGVEAAVRAMAPSGKTREEVEDFVRSLIKKILDSGQLANSPLTLKDIDTAIGAFMRVFKGLYHERIPYPNVRLRTEAAEAPESVEPSDTVNNPIKGEA